LLLLSFLHELLQLEVLFLDELKYSGVGFLKPSVSNFKVIVVFL
jgi:hypothetical protein